MNTCRTFLIHILAGAWLVIAMPVVLADTTELITVGNGEILTANGRSIDASVSTGGRYVAFESDASNLVSGDTNERTDIFVRDRGSGTTTRVSVDDAGVQGNGDSRDPDISADGRYVTFKSIANNLVSDDTNWLFDIFVHDRNTSTTTRVSVDSAGLQGNSYNHDPAISGDGRYVAFRSASSNLVSGDTYGQEDIFVHDRDTGATTRMSVDSAGEQCNDDSYNVAISADGRYVAFRTYADNLVSGDTNSASDIFVHDRDTGTTTRASVDSAGVQGDSNSLRPVLSGDGRYVAFQSFASNLVHGDTNGLGDIFVHDRDTGTTTRVSVDSAGVQGNNYSDNPVLSADGRYVAFQSFASNLVSEDTNEHEDIFVHDRDTGATERVNVDSAGVQANSDGYDPAISAGGRYVAFVSNAGNLVSGDLNNLNDIFVHDRNIDTTDTASLAEVPWIGANGGSSPGHVSAYGRYVTFDSFASNLIAGNTDPDTNNASDIFVYDRDTGTTTRVSVDSAGLQGDGSSRYPDSSADGRHVAFASSATNLVSGDTNGAYDIFVHDRDTGTTMRVSVDSTGVQGNDDSFGPAISADGRYVAFESDASNLVSGATNGSYDIFVHDRATGATTRVSVDSAGLQSNSDSYYPALSADGRYVAFQSFASNLVSGDTNNASDIFVHDRETGDTMRVSVDSTGVQGNSNSFGPDSSADGRYVAFGSFASNLVSGDTNVGGIFVHDRETGDTMRVSVDSAGVQGNSYSYDPVISADGRYVAFDSDASNLVSGDTNFAHDIFVHDRNTGTTVRVSVNSTGAQGNGDSGFTAISADGMSVVFGSSADNLDPPHLILVPFQVYLFTFDNTDGDGHPDYVDNCVTIPNGGQVDTDRDGFGNICDGDFNDDCGINFPDLSRMKEVFFINDTSPDWDPDVDLNNDGAVNFVDLQVMKFLFFGPPGPSSIQNICEAGCGLRATSHDPAEAFGVELFARGSFNGWGSAPPYNLINYGDGVYRTQVEIGAGLYEFKIADELWTLEYDGPTQMRLDVPVILTGGIPDGSPNIAIDLPTSGCYNFRVETLGAPPAHVELNVSRKP